MVEVKVKLDTKSILEELDRAGITALVRAGEAEDWFAGHFGAAMISGVRLLREPDLPGPAALALSARLQEMRAAHREWYSPLRDLGRSVVGVEPILDALRESAGTLRRAGHPTIYMSGALHALSRQTSLATERVVTSLIRLHDVAQEDDPARHYGHSDYFETIEKMSLDVGLNERGGASFDALRGAIAGLEHLVMDQQIDGRHYFLTGEKIHLLTHAHAMATLEELGHADIAALAGRAQRSLIRLTGTSDTLPASLVESARSTPFEAGFWEQQVPDLSHVIKLAEAVVAQLGRLPEDEREVARTRLSTLWGLLGIR